MYIRVAVDHRPTEIVLSGQDIDAINVQRITVEPSSLGWIARIIGVCVSGIVFLLTTLVLLTVSLPGMAALVAAAAAASLTAAVFVLVWPEMEWRAGFWASAGFLVYFVLAAVAYMISGRPDWHPLLAGFVVTTAACLSAAIVGRLQSQSRNKGSGGASR